MNSVGHVLYQGNSSGNVAKLSNLVAGVYYIILIDERGSDKIAVKTIVIQ